MLHLLLLALAPVFIEASGLAAWQEPLLRPPGGSRCGRGRAGLHYGSAFSFGMNGDWRYYFTDYFPSDWHCSRGELTRLDMGVLDDISNRVAPPKPPEAEPNPNAKKKSKSKPKNKMVSFMVTIPLDPEAEGPLIIEPEPGWKLFHHWDTSVEIFWTDSKQPGRGLNITSVGLTKNATISAATSGAHLALETPYIFLPGDIYDYLFLATRPQRVDMGRNMRPVDVVDCDSISRFPNINLEFQKGVEKLVIRPEQYVLRVNENLGGPFANKCVLLAARGGGEVTLGFAAVRGRTLWFDWANARTGFGIPKL